MLLGLSEYREGRTHKGRIPEAGSCKLKLRLMDDFLDAVHALSVLQNQQTQALVEGDPDFPRFDVLLHFAQEQKDLAKYAWIAHVESHGCGEG